MIKWIKFILKFGKQIIKNLIKKLILIKNNKYNYI